MEVPLFQRQYVWSEEQQWQPLWEDLSRKFVDYIEGRKDSPLHFLGAMVLDQKQVPTTHVESRQVIDGQQRLTTFQIFIAALRDYCRLVKADDLAGECDLYLLNGGLLNNPEVERYKVWPTQLDREQFAAVVCAGSREKLEAMFPLARAKYARVEPPRPRMVEAYLYFSNQIAEFFSGNADAAPPAGERPLQFRLHEAWTAIRHAFRVVVIDLDRDDDAQVIFETLNARGAPLSPVDLVRNYIFLRAVRAGEDIETLYGRYWLRFDDPFWREEVTQGRLSRPRSDLFLQHFLASQQAREIPIRHLFAEYRFWIEGKRPFRNIQEELEKVSSMSDEYRKLVTPERGSALCQLSVMAERFDMSTVFPLLLRICELRIGDVERRAIAGMLESYIVRRAVCGLTTKNYNHVFLGLTRELNKPKGALVIVQLYLSGLSGNSGVWPDNQRFANCWLTQPVYRTLKKGRLAYVLERLNERYIGSRHEDVTINGSLTVEHLMPQEWRTHWPLPGGYGDVDFVHAGPEHPGVIAHRRREELVQTMGNLTILTQELNSSVSNGPWLSKRQAILRGSLLPINARFLEHENWDEDAIQARGKALLHQALAMWPGPGGDELEREEDWEVSMNDGLSKDGERKLGEKAAAPEKGDIAVRKPASNGTPVPLVHPQTLGRAAKEYMYMPDRQRKKGGPGGGLSLSQWRALEELVVKCGGRVVFSAKELLHTFYADWPRNQKHSGGRPGIRPFEDERSPDPQCIWAEVRKVGHGQYDLRGVLEEARKQFGAY